MPTKQNYKQGILRRIHEHLSLIYADVDVVISTDEIAEEMYDVMGLGATQSTAEPYVNKWHQGDAVLITYGDSILSPSSNPLHCLRRFLQQHVQNHFSSVHILPFFPYSSDDGFAVIDFSSVNESLGDWEDIVDIANDYQLMADLVINHCSSQGIWFENFKQGRSPGRDYFICVDPESDLSAVVRPRTSSLLRETETLEGVKHVWCTFGHDQVDLNFRNPEVLVQIVRLIRLYLDKGVRIFRLDAVAFLWKQIGTDCLNLEPTHEIIRLLRTLMDFACNDAIIITETNIPNRDNLSYFGNANEAHCIYNFSLPPLLLHALVTGQSRFLKQWMMSMPPARNGTAYLNFIASHDGIGLRPAEGLLMEDDIDALIGCLRAFGGRVSWRAESGKDRPYEINIALFDACRGTIHGEDQWRDARYILAHTIMLSLEGIPAIYIHSLLATPNDTDRADSTGNNRAINRHKWNEEKLNDLLSQQSTPQFKTLLAIKNLLERRSQQPAFHPNATQFTLHLGEKIFGFWRQSSDRLQSIFCIFNMTRETQEFHLGSINLIETDNWYDILSGEPLKNISEVLSLAPYQGFWISNR
ncbi:MAG: sugar phosphorylase [Pseudomonadota bacterium]